MKSPARITTGSLGFFGLVLLAFGAAYHAAVSHSEDKPSGPAKVAAKPAPRTAGPEYNAQGELKLPADFETWVFVGSNLGLETLPRHGGADVGHDVARRGGHAELVGSPASNLLRIQAGADDLHQEAAQPFVGSGGPPLALGCGVDLVHQARTSPAAALDAGLHDQARGEELGEVLGTLVE